MLAGLLLGAEAAAQTAVRKEAVSASSPPVIAYTADYPPYADKGLPDGGLSVALVRAAFAASGYAVALEEVPGNRALYEVEQGTRIAAFPLARTKAREKLFQYSVVLLPIASAVFVRQNSDWPGLMAVRNDSICVPTGWPVPRAVADRVLENHLLQVQANDLQSCIRLVAAGRAGFLIHDPAVILTVARKMSVEHHLAVAERNITTSGQYMIARQNDPQARLLLDKLEEGLLRIRGDGTYDRLVRSVIGVAD